MDETSHSRCLWAQCCIHCSALAWQEDLTRADLLGAGRQERVAVIAGHASPSRCGPARWVAPSQPTPTASKGGTRYQLPQAAPGPRRPAVGVAGHSQIQPTWARGFCLPLR